MAERLPFFVYGTLREGQGNFEYFLDGNVSAVHRAVLPNHQLLSASLAYVTDAADGGQVIGDLMIVRPDRYDEVLRRLDRLEGYRPHDEAGSHYVRVARPVRYRCRDCDRGSDTWQETRAWVYHGGRAALARLTSADRVPGGDWLAWPACQAA